MKFQRVVTVGVWSVCLGSALLVACGGDTEDVSDLFPSDSGVVSDATTMVGLDATSTSDATTIVVTGDDASSGDDGSALGTGDGSTDGGLSDAGDASDANALSDGGMVSLTVYAGQTATAPSTSAGATYIWTLTSAPAGSAVTTASISNATSANAGLPTDLAGTYVYAVSATTGSNTIDSTVTVVAVAAHVVYGIDDRSDASVSYSGIGTTDTDGTNAHPIICSFAVGSRGVTGAIETIDTREGAPGTATTVVFGGPESVAQTSYTAQLYITNTDGTCPTAGAPGASATSIYSTTVSQTVSSAVNQMHPRFSANGTKVAFVTAFEALNGSRDTASTVNVVNVDGTSPLSLGVIGDVTDISSTPNSDVGVSRQPEWVDATHVDWTRAAGSSGWSVVTSSVPAAAGDPVTTMTCASATNASFVPTRALPLPGGSFLVINRPTATGASDLFVLQPDPTTKACVVVRNLSNLTAVGSSAVRAFALSPDGKTVAYAAEDLADSGTMSMLVYTAPLDGSSAPRRVGATSATDLQSAIRWVAGGSQVAFTHATTTDAGTAAQAVAATTFLNDASVVTDVLTGDAGITLTAVGDGDGASCSFGGKNPPVLELFGVLGLLGLARRRQRRARNLG